MIGPFHHFWWAPRSRWCSDHLLTSSRTRTSVIYPGAAIASRETFTPPLKCLHQRFPEAVLKPGVIFGADDIAELLAEAKGSLPKWGAIFNENLDKGQHLI